MDNQLVWMVAFKSSLKESNWMALVSIFLKIGDIGFWVGYPIKILNMKNATYFYFSPFKLLQQHELMKLFYKVMIPNIVQIILSTLLSCKSFCLVFLIVEKGGNRFS